MHEFRGHACTICGEQKRTSDLTWFLVAESRWDDKLKVLQWDERVAAQPGVHYACNSSHVEELVVHWMVTGRLDYPFAQVSIGPNGNVQVESMGPTTARDIDTTGARQIGELSVHRESLQRALAENPRSLKTILDALSKALEGEIPPKTKHSFTERQIFSSIG